MTERAFPKLFEEIERAPSASVVEEALGAILAGEWTPVQVASFAVALRMRGESAAMIAAAARAMRRVMVPVEHAYDVVLDTCGTGGDGRGTINVSTAAAIVAAAAGIKVAKHGNRAVSSRSGSADVVEALGLPLDLPAEASARILAEAGIAFLMAPIHHPAMRHAAAARRELGIRTIFNCLGPLCNPARATHQVIGTYDDALLPVFASTLAELGSKRAWILRGTDGLDEVSPSGKTLVMEMDAGVSRRFEVTPAEFGLEPSPEGAMDGGDARENAKALTSLLRGELHPARDALVLNAAAALVVATGSSFRDAAERARALLDSGAAYSTLERWRAAADAARA